MRRRLPHKWKSPFPSPPSVRQSVRPSAPASDPEDRSGGRGCRHGGARWGLGSAAAVNQGQVKSRPQENSFGRRVGRRSMSFRGEIRPRGENGEGEQRRGKAGRGDGNEGRMEARRERVRCGTDSGWMTACDRLHVLHSGAEEGREGGRQGTWMMMMC